MIDDLMFKVQSYGLGFKVWGFQKFRVWRLSETHWYIKHFFSIQNSTFKI